MPTTFSSRSLTLRLSIRRRERGEGGKLSFPQFNNSTDHNWPIIGARKRVSAVLRGIIFWEKNKISGKVSQEGLPRLIWRSQLRPYRGEGRSKDTRSVGRGLSPYNWPLIRGFTMLFRSALFVPLAQVLMRLTKWDSRQGSNTNRDGFGSVVRSQSHSDVLIYWCTTWLEN